MNLVTVFMEINMSRTPPLDVTGQLHYQVLCPRGRSPQLYLTEDLEGPRSGLDVVANR